MNLSEILLNNKILNETNNRTTISNCYDEINIEILHVIMELKIL